MLKIVVLMFFMVLANAQSLTMSGFTPTTNCSNYNYFTIPFSYSNITLPVKVELSDLNGSFANPRLISTSSTSPANVYLPQDVPTGSSYKIRLKSSGSMPVFSSESDPFLVQLPIYAFIQSGNYSISEGDTAQMQMTIHGLKPYSYAINNGPVQTTYLNDFTIPASPLSNASYQITYADNACAYFTRSGIYNLTVLPLSRRLVSCFPFNGVVLDTKKRNNIAGSNLIYSIDRFGQPNASLSLLNNTSLVLPTDGFSQTEFSVCFWAKLSAGNHCFFSFNDTDFITSDGQQISINSNGNTQSFNSNFSGWNFYTYIRGQNGYKMFVNNVLKATLAGIGAVNLPAGFNAKVGSKINNDLAMNGLLDDFKVFKGELTNKEVQTLFLSTNACYNAVINDCPDKSFVSTAVSSPLLPHSNYYGIYSLKANTKIEGSILLKFESALAVELLPGFEAPLGSVFQAKTNVGCY